MLFLSYVLAIVAIVLFYIFSTPGRTKEMLEKTDPPLLPRLISSVVVTGLLILITSYFGISGTYSFGVRGAFAFLLSAVILLSYNILIVNTNLQEFHMAIKNQYFSEDSEIQKKIKATEEKRKALEIQEADLLETESILSSEQEELLHKTARVQALEASLAALDTKLSDEKIRWEKFVQNQVVVKENQLKSRYEADILLEKKKLQEDYNNRVLTFVNSATQKMQQRIHSDKKDLLDDIFSFDDEGSDDFFEMKQLKETLTQEKEEIEKSRFLIDMEQKVAHANEHVINAKSSALDIKSENVDLRTELKLMASDFKMDITKEQLTRENTVDSLFHKLEIEQERRKSDFQIIGSKLEVMDVQSKMRFVEMHSSFSNALKYLQISTADGFRDVRDRMGDMKLQFGNEVLRLDGQQGQILTELEKYYAKNQLFVNQCQNIALEAKRQNMEGNNLLNQVNSMYGQHKLETREMENRLRTSMDQVSVKEGQLANSVGESMLKLKSISDQQYSIMRDMALEKKDINLLWKEKNGEHDRNLQEVRHQKQDLDMTRQLLKQEQSSFEKNKTNAMDSARLTHRNYMQEQEYKMAMWKAENSGGWLSRWAKRIENNTGK